MVVVSEGGRNIRTAILNFWLATMSMNLPYILYLLLQQILIRTVPNTERAKVCEQGNTFFHETIFKTLNDIKRIYSDNKRRVTKK